MGTDRAVAAAEAEGAGQAPRRRSGRLERDSLSAAHRMPLGRCAAPIRFSRHLLEEAAPREADGRWESIWQALLQGLDEQGRLEWSKAFPDGSFARERGRSLNFRLPVIPELLNPWRAGLSDRVGFHLHCYWDGPFTPILMIFGGNNGHLADRMPNAGD